ncbi:caffeine-induced death protein 2-domain-containing protein [Gaertneriomyces semiglobifer]|nr:caffeine-induced death protein 2-domain-containing protein [Gaertneriomyces semiglobifer]
MRVVLAAHTAILQQKSLVFQTISADGKKSTAMAATEATMDYSAVCENMSVFKDVLKRLRAFDDNVIPRLNALTTRTENSSKSCQAFYEELQTAYRTRETLISHCVRHNSEKLAMRRSHARQDDSTSSMDIATDEARLRAIKVEMTVEAIIRERTAEVFKARCWNTIVPPQLWNPSFTA